MSDTPIWEAGELARLVMTHRLPAALVDLMHGADVECASLLLNIFVRLEVRCCGDSGAIVAALHRPSAEFNDCSIVECFADKLGIANLRLLRDVAGSIPLAKVKSWRLPDTYS